MPSRRHGSLAAALGLLLLGWGAAIAGTPLDDNSFFTHLSTGRLILDTGSVPSVDPYSFTAAGRPWTVQSWLPSIFYAAAERIGADAGLRAVALLTFVGASALVWRLSREAESALLRLAAAATAMLVFTGTWSNRPYMVGFVLLGAVWLALDGAFKPWFLAPLAWIWTNSHGSYPLAFVLIGSTLFGHVIDLRAQRAPVGPSVARELRVLGFFALGTVAGVVGPLGLDVLTFPTTSLTRSGSFEGIIEWQAPRFRTVPELAFLVLAAFTLAAVARRGSWRTTVPVLVFLVGALYAQRNIVFAALVFLPVLTRSMPVVGTLRGSSPVRPAVIALPLLLVVSLSADVLMRPAVTDLEGYPVAAVSWLEDRGVLDESIIARDTVGNLLEVLYGTEVETFVDDRADMFPPEVIDDFVLLLRGESRWTEALDEFGARIVLWERQEPLTSLLATSDEWKLAFQDGDWVIACRRSNGCALLTGR